MPAAAPPPPLDDSERQLLTLADGLPVGVLVISEARIYAANATAALRFGRDAGALRGLPAAALFIDGADAAALLDSDLPCDTHAPLRRADGTAFRAEVGLRTLRLGTRELRLMFVCDLSESDRIHAQLAHQHEELQAMARRLLSVQEDERRTLSRELHDDIGQQITAIKLGALALRGDDDPARRDETIAEIIAITDQTIVKLRNLSLLLRPPQLDALGLEAALRWQTDVLFRGGAPRLELAITPLPQRPAPEVELACFRIAQEALTNVLRHAGASAVRLELGARDGWLRLSVVDDGCGLRDAPRAEGLGLVTMRERAQQLGGCFAFEPAKPCGTRVHAELPMDAGADDASMLRG